MQIFFPWNERAGNRQGKQERSSRARSQGIVTYLKKSPAVREGVLYPGTAVASGPPYFHGPLWNTDRLFLSPFQSSSLAFSHQREDHSAKELLLQLLSMEEGIICSIHPASEITVIVIAVIIIIIMPGRLDQRVAGTARAIRQAADFSSSIYN